MWLDNQSAVNQHILWCVPSAWGAIKLLVVNDCCSSGTLTSLGRQRGGGGVPDWKMNFAHAILHFEPRAVHFSVCKCSKSKRLEQELQDQTSSLLFQWRPLLSSFYQGRHWHDKIDQASPPPPNQAIFAYCKQSKRKAWERGYRNPMISTVFLLPSMQLLHDLWEQCLNLLFSVLADIVSQPAVSTILFPTW